MKARLFFFFLLEVVVDWIVLAKSGGENIKGVFGNMIGVVFQSMFYLKMH